MCSPTPAPRTVRQDRAASRPPAARAQGRKKRRWARVQLLARRARGTRTASQTVRAAAEQNVPGPVSIQQHVARRPAARCWVCVGDPAGPHARSWLQKGVCQMPIFFFVLPVLTWPLTQSKVELVQQARLTSARLGGRRPAEHRPAGREWRRVRVTGWDGLWRVPSGAVLAWRRRSVRVPLKMVVGLPHALEVVRAHPGAEACGCFCTHAAGASARTIPVFAITFGTRPPRRKEQTHSRSHAAQSSTHAGRRPSTAANERRRHAPSAVRRVSDGECTAHWRRGFAGRRSGRRDARAQPGRRHRHRSFPLALAHPPLPVSCHSPCQLSLRCTARVVPVSAAACLLARDMSDDG